MSTFDTSSKETERERFITELEDLGEKTEKFTHDVFDFVSALYQQKLLSDLYTFKSEIEDLIKKEKEKLS